MSEEDTEVSAVAQVQVTVEVVLSQPWGRDFTLAQVHEEAERSARTRVEAAIGRLHEGGIRILDVPLVRAVLVSRKRR